MNLQTDRAENVLYNKSAMAILKRARDDLDALGLHTSLGPSVGADELNMAAALAISTDNAALVDRLVRSLVVDEYVRTPEGKAHYQRELAEFLARAAIYKASDIE